MKNCSLEIDVKRIFIICIKYLSTDFLYKIHQECAPFKQNLQLMFIVILRSLLISKFCIIAIYRKPVNVNIMESKEQKGLVIVQYNNRNLSR
jgi:hypothetical protein